MHWREGYYCCYCYCRWHCYSATGYHPAAVAVLDDVEQLPQPLPLLPPVVGPGPVDLPPPLPGLLARLAAAVDDVAAPQHAAVPELAPVLVAAVPSLSDTTRYRTSSNSCR